MASGQGYLPAGAPQRCGLDMAQLETMLVADPRRYFSGPFCGPAT
jgi:hypothetical protein